MANITDLLETDTWPVSLSKINSNINELNDNKIETDRIVTSIVWSWNTNDIPTTWAVVNKIGSLWWGNVISTITPANEDIVVYDWTWWNLIKNEARKTAFNKDFGNTTSDIPAIWTTLWASSVVETDSNNKLITASKWTAYNKNFGTTAWTVVEWNDSRLASATETTEWLVERATDAEATTWSDTTRYITPKQVKDNYWIGWKSTQSFSAGNLSWQATWSWTIPTWTKMIICNIKAYRFEWWVLAWTENQVTLIPWFLNTVQVLDYDWVYYWFIVSISWSNITITSIWIPFWWWSTANISWIVYYI